MGNKPGKLEEAGSVGNEQPVMRQSRLAKAGASAVGANHSTTYQLPNHSNATTTKVAQSSQLLQTSQSSKKSSSIANNRSQQSPITSNVRNSASTVATVTNASSPPSSSYSNTNYTSSNGNSNKMTVSPTKAEASYEGKVLELDESEIEPSPREFVRYVPPPQTNLWEQQQKIQLQIESQNRRNIRSAAALAGGNTLDKKVEEPVYDGLINGRGKGFDPDKFKRANNKLGGEYEPSSTPVQRSPVSSRSSPSLVNKVEEKRDIGRDTGSVNGHHHHHHPEVQSSLDSLVSNNTEVDKTTIRLEPSEVYVVHDDNGSHHTPSKVGSIDQKSHDLREEKAYLNFSDHDESLMDDILGDIGN